MDATLPDELLLEILSWGISIPHNEFLTFSVDARRPSCASNLLLVSKRWLRIGTPLLYTCLRLRSPEHTKAVARLFLAQPRVGRAVRCLRLEGGFGMDLVHIAEHTPHIHTVFLDLRVKPTDNISGLKKVLPTLRIPHLYVQTYIRRDRNLEALELLELLEAYIKVADSLRTIAFWGRFWRMTRELADALAVSSIEELDCGNSSVGGWIESGLMQRICKNPRLRRAYTSTMLAGTVGHLERAGFSAANIQKFQFIPREEGEL